MTQSPRYGDAAPVDNAHTGPVGSGGRGGESLSSAPSNGGFGSGVGAGAGGHGGWGSVGTSTHGGSAPAGSAATSSGSSRPVEKLPAPDTPTASVPPVTDERRDASTSRADAPAADPSRRQRARGPRRARLQLRHINPWTVLKFSCVLAVALFFVWLIIVGVLYGVLDAAGVIGKLNDAYDTLKSDGSGSPITAGTVFGAAAIVGLINIVLFIALSTIGSVVYNLCADLVGGVEVTLSES